MAETTTVTPLPAGGDAMEVGGAGSLGGAPSAAAPVGSAERTPPSRPPMNRIYALPAPIRTFPLPTFYPSNPISLLHLAYAWLSQVLRPPPPEPSVIHTGVWDPETRSVHVRDDSSIRALWEQGFYGKGSLSRSEPNWLKRELARRGSPEGKTVSEARTELRREERRLAKWERAKAELEALEQQRLVEAASNDAASEAIAVNGVLPEPVVTADTLAIPAAVMPSVAEPASVDAVAETSTETAPPTKIAQAQKSETHLEGHPHEPKPPVGPAELLALPNSLPKLSRLPNGLAPQQPAHRHIEHKAPVGPAELLLLPNSHADLVSRPVSGLAIFEIGQSAPSQPTLQATLDLNGHASGTSFGGPEMNGAVNGDVAKASASAGTQEMDQRSDNGPYVNGAAVPPSSLPSNGPIFNLPTRDPEDDVSLATKRPNQDVEGDAAQASKRRKSVRFSPTVESTTFLHSDPPSPSRSASATSKSVGPSLANREAVTALDIPPTAPLVPENAAGLNGDAAGMAEIENKEHFQLAPEEALFLAFSLGALQVVDPVTGSPISTEDLLSLFRTHSYFPPRAAGSLRPDDPFLVNYAVYHHFRSLGWVPRHGIKFGVDWIIYQRGPAFDHSEFGIMVMPAYSDAGWEGQEHEEPKKSWSWLMGVNRVLSHVLKSLVLVYVDIPTPAVFNEEMARGGISAALKKYTIREVMVRRFSVNRNR